MLSRPVTVAPRVGLNTELHNCTSAGSLYVRDAPTLSRPDVPINWNLQTYTAFFSKCQKLRSLKAENAGPSDRSPAEIVGSNPTGGMDVCLLWVLCVVR